MPQHKLVETTVYIVLLGVDYRIQLKEARCLLHACSNKGYESNSLEQRLQSLFEVEFLAGGRKAGRCGRGVWEIRQNGNKDECTYAKL